MTTEPIAIPETTELRGARILLRRPRMSDTGPLGLYAGDQRVASMTTSIPHPYPPGAAEAFVTAVLAGRSPEIVWAIDATPDGGAELVGLIGVKRASADLGYWVGPPFWGTGYATEAALLVCRHLLTAGVERITASAFFDNPASCRVLAHVGFRPTGDAWAYSVARQMEVPTRCHALTAADLAAVP